MANGITRWRPNTCGCVVLYQWTANERGEPTIRKVAFENVCRAHMFAQDDAARFEQVKADNRKAAG